LADPRRGFRSKKARSSKYLEEVDAAGKCRISGNSGGFPSAASTPGERLLLIPCRSSGKRRLDRAPGERHGTARARRPVFSLYLTGRTDGPAG